MLPYCHIADMVIHMKTTLNIDDTLMRRLRQEAARRDSTMTALVEAGRLAPGVYGLRALHSAGPTSDGEVPQESSDHSGQDATRVAERTRRVRIPLFPI